MQCRYLIPSLFTPARTLSIIGLKSRVLKLSCLSLKILVKSGLQFILKLTEPLQSCCCPVQKYLPRMAELAWQLSRDLTYKKSYNWCGKAFGEWEKCWIARWILIFFSFFIMKKLCDLALEYATSLTRQEQSRINAISFRQHKISQNWAYFKFVRVLKMICPWTLWVWF